MYRITTTNLLYNFRHVHQFFLRLKNWQRMRQYNPVLQKITGAVQRTHQGQIFAFLLGVIAICGGLGLLFLGRSIIGLSVLIGAVASLIGVFIYGKESNKKEQKNE